MLQCLSMCIYKCIHFANMSLTTSFIQCEYILTAQEIPKQSCCQRFAAGGTTTLHKRYGLQCHQLACRCRSANNSMHSPLCPCKTEPNMKKEKLSAREAAWATLLMTVSSRANKPVKYMMDSTVKASDVSLGWVTRGHTCWVAAACNGIQGAWLWR